MAYRVQVTRTVARQLAQRLPAEAAVACVEFLYGPLVADPHRTGAPLRKPFEAQWRARRGEYRVRYTVDEESQTITVVDVSHRRDAYW